jgi:hypothetical protein
MDAELEDRQVDADINFATEWVRMGHQYDALLSYDSQGPFWVCSCDDGWFIEVRAVGKAKDWAVELPTHLRRP